MAPFFDAVHFNGDRVVACIFTNKNAKFIMSYFYANPHPEGLVVKYHNLSMVFRLNDVITEGPRGKLMVYSKTDFLYLHTVDLEEFSKHEQ